MRVVLVLLLGYVHLVVGSGDLGVPTSMKPQQSNCSSTIITTCFAALGELETEGHLNKRDTKAPNDCAILKALVDCASGYPQCNSDNYVTMGRAIVLVLARLRNVGLCRGDRNRVDLTKLMSLVAGTSVAAKIGFTDGFTCRDVCIPSVDAKCFNHFHKSLDRYGMCKAADGLSSCLLKETKCSSHYVFEIQRVLEMQTIVDYLQTEGRCLSRQYERFS
ncbi:unnamed protein product [Owenia fusiformis]|uniref:Secreted protein n=2 Tax=Owenia fusiformis TaxID=6347 RepID=A0A8S4P5I9_OWEFU|nr:unnamed protein product [Owenia fusiformis]